MRYLIFALLLVASHGLAIWAGVEARGQGKKAVSTPAAGHAGVGEKIELSQYMRPEEPKAPKNNPAAIDWSARYEAALQSFPADADLAAIVRAGTADKNGIITPETRAAFAVWMERNAEAALRWQAAWYAANGSTLDEGLRRYVGSHPVSDLDQLLRSVPEGRDTLLGAAVVLAKQEGADALARLATGLSSGSDRMWVLAVGLRSAEGLGPHLAAIRSGMDERAMREFLGNLGKLEHAGDLLESVRAAGFSEDAVRGFEKAVGDNAESWRQKSMGVAELLRSGGLGNRDTAYRLESKLAAELPDFAGWCRDFGDARLTVDEVMSRMKEGMADSAGIDDPLRELLFRKLYPLDPTAAVAWLRENRKDWQGLVKQVSGDALNEVSLEKLHKIADSMSKEELEASGIQRCVMTRYDWWCQRDPVNCVAAVERLPDGEFKQQVRARIKERQEREARQSSQ